MRRSHLGAQPVMRKRRPMLLRASNPRRFRWKNETLKFWSDIPRQRISKFCGRVQIRIVFPLRQSSSHNHYDLVCDLARDYCRLLPGRRCSRNGAAMGDNTSPLCRVRRTAHRSYKVLDLPRGCLAATSSQDSVSEKCDVPNANTALCTK